MTAKSPLGIVHAMGTDELGWVADCGGWSPDTRPELTVSDALTCRGCLHFHQKTYVEVAVAKRRGEVIEMPRQRRRSRPR